MKNLKVSNNICPYLANSVLMLLTGKITSEIFTSLQESFGHMRNECMTMYLGEDNTAGGDDIIMLPNTTELKDNSNFITALDAAIRKTKSHKCFNSNDLTVCLFLDSDSINAYQIADICKELYDILSEVYYNHVHFDVYFLLLDGFALRNDVKSKNENANKIISNISQQDWIRYIYLLSDVNSKGQLIEDRNELFRIMLDASFLTNCLVNNESINRLQDVFIQESENSKYFCIGQAILYPSQQDIRQMVRTVLLQQLLKEGNHKDASPKMPSFLKVLHDDIQNAILKKVLGLTPVEPITLPSSISCLTNFDYLYLFYKNEPMQKMDQIETECKKELSKKVDYYCQQVDIWLNDLLDQFNMSFWNPQYEKIVMTTVISFINRYQSQIGIHFKETHEKYLSWKNQQISVKRKARNQKKEELANQLLKQWWQLQMKERSYRIQEHFISEICSRIRLWQENIKKKCELLSEIQIDADYRWGVLLQQSTPTQKLLLEYQRKSFSTYLIQNSWKLDTCRQQLNSLMRNEISSETIENIISPSIEQLFWEMRQFSVPWQSICHKSDLKATQIEELYMELYHIIETDILLNAHRNISNVEPYLCFYGGSCNQFIDYINDQKKFDYVLCVDAPYTLAKIFYFQNLSPSSMFFWKKSNSNGEKK